MNGVRLAFMVLVAVVLWGCSALGGPTDSPQTPGWVKTLDAITGVNAKLDATGKTVVTQGSPIDPTGGTIPIASTAIGGLALAWYMIRKLAAAHSDAIAGLSNSNPATVTTTTAVPQAAPVAPVPAVKAT